MNWLGYHLSKSLRTIVCIEILDGWKPKTSISLVSHNESLVLSLCRSPLIYYTIKNDLLLCYTAKKMPSQNLHANLHLGYFPDATNSLASLDKILKYWKSKKAVISSALSKSLVYSCFLELFVGIAKGKIDCCMHLALCNFVMCL